MSGDTIPLRCTRVVIAGGGVGALEALLALREILDIRPHVDLIAPNRRFVYQPMAVAEPFGLARTSLFELPAIAADLGAELHVSKLARVDGPRRRVELADGSSLAYDAAILAVGARRRPWLDGALHFGGAEDAPELTDLVGRLERGSISRVAITAPPAASWTLPLYELALLTASRLADRGLSEVQLTVVTPEPEPFSIFGHGAARMLRGLLGDRGIRLRTGASAVGISDGRLELASGDVLDVDEVVALPRLAGPRLQGVPADADGFIRVDEGCRVPGLSHLYAVGDGAAFPVKQGGLATQQADVAAEAVARDLGAPVQPAAYEPVLRGLLVTGIAPLYLRASEQAPGAGEVAASALWWPPTKIAGRYLAPYLACMSAPEGRGTMTDRRAPEREPGTLRVEHDEARELALVFAEADARSGDFSSALRWLEVVEHLDGVLPAGYLERRESWRLRAVA